MTTTETSMNQAVRLAEMFGGDGDDVEVPTGNHEGWSWADVVLGAALRRAGLDGNPYEYGAYDAISDEWVDACDEMEAGSPGAEQRVRLLLAKYSDSLA